jgi:hypothetical protein
MFRGLLVLALLQASVATGDRVEQAHRAYAATLAAYFADLRATVLRETPALVTVLEPPPIEPVVYGYQLLPDITADPAAPVGGRSLSASSRRYSWPITAGYISGEETKIARARAALEAALRDGVEARHATLERLVAEYRELRSNQSTVDQYVQYNRLWQRAILEDRRQFDAMTELYTAVVEREKQRASGKPEETGSGPDPAIQMLQPSPRLPAFVRVTKEPGGGRVLKVPVYTDIESSLFLSRAEEAIERFWQARDHERSYAVDVDFRHVAPSRLYRSVGEPRRGEHIDIDAHADRFPKAGAVLTTGAHTTYASVGRFVALGTAPLPERVLAHEFGHLLGFRDTYFRGYRDLGPEGFEIVEFVPDFEDIMSAPRDGRVQPFHFERLLASIGDRR